MSRTTSVHRLSPTLLALAIAALCAGHALDARAEGDDAKPSQVVVNGAADNGYRVERAGMGPLGEQSTLDTPYSINVIPAALSDGQQLKSVREAFRYLPSVQGENIRPQTRGLQAGVVQNTRIDGLNMASTTDYPIEQFDRIEVLDGLAGALYGPANPAGTFNYVLKRPTTEPLRQLTVGYTTRRDGMLHADLGGSFGADNRAGYRVNLIDENGEGYVDRSRLQRKLASLAFDFRFDADTVLETNGSYYHYVDMGFPGTFSLASNVNFPSAPDPTRVGYGQPFGGDDNVTNTGVVRLKHDFNPDWHLSAGVLRQNSDRASTVPTNTLTNNAGAYTVTAATTTFSLDTILSNSLTLNGHVQAAGLSHDLVIATTGFDWDRYQPYAFKAVTLGTANLNNPVLFNQPAWPNFKYRYRSAFTHEQSLTLGDTVHFNDAWSAMLVASQSWIDASNYNSAGVTTSSYGDQGVSPSASISYKPRKNMSVYVTYADNLQQGDAAPSGTVNAGANLAPYRSKQWELGYKVELARLNLSTALFRVERPYAYVDTSNVFRVQGEQVNRGIEFMVNGALTRELTIYGGISLLDPKLHNTGAALTNDSQILGLSRRAANVLTEYRVPAVAGLTLSFNLNYLGDRPGNNSDSIWVSGYAVADLGARYASTLMGKEAIWSLSAKNIGDKQYWANITPSGQNGYTGTGNGTGTLGAPRTVRANLQINF